MLRASSPPTGALPAFAWAADDFRAPPDAPTPCADPWEIVPEGPHAPEPHGVAHAETWVWDEPSALAAAEDAARFDETPDWALFLELPPFDPRAGEKSFVPPVVLPAEESRAAKRARWLVDLLDVAEAGRRRRHIRFFEALFLAYPHGSTFKALSAIAVEKEPTAELLIEACRFREKFLERPEWWACRKAWGHFKPAGGEALMSWRKAFRLCEAAGMDPACLIEDEWIAEWARLPLGDPLSWTFASYIEDMIMRSDRGGSDLPGEPGDALGDRRWLRDIHGLSLGARTANLVALRSRREGEKRPC